MNRTATETTAFLPPRRLAWFAAALLAACLLLALSAGAADAAFGIKGFDGEVTTESAEAATQAGSHPFKATTTIQFNETTTPAPIEVPIPDGSFKDLKTFLPAGLVGNPHATPRCSLKDFMGGEFLNKGACPDDTAVGTATLLTTYIPEIHAPVYNLKPGPNQAARFGFHVISASIFLNVSVRTGGDYGLTIEIPNSSQGLPVVATTLSLWGVPAAHAHDTERGKCLDPFSGPTGAECESDVEAAPFLTNPTSCSGPVSTGLAVDSWQAPGDFAQASFLSHDPAHQPVGAEGCEELPFEPSLQVTAEPGSAASPSALDVHLNIPQHEGVNELATAHLRKVAVTLPQGVTVNASAANGLGTCAEAQIEIQGPAPAACPDDSKIGTAKIVSPLLDDPLQGAVYLARQGENEFHSLLAVYLAAEADGVLVKLPGRIDTDPVTGQVTATFDEAPQLPFSDLDVRFFGGNSGVLAAPATCGTYTASGTFTPWSGTPPVTKTASFAVTKGPNGGACPDGSFAAKLSAGTIKPTAGHYSPFVLNLSREDGSPAVTGIDAELPKGLLAKLAGIPYCPDAALAGIPTAAGTGAAQLASPSCPAASQVGTVAVSAGTGPSPFFVNTGKAYLAGPYKGAPLSLALVTPAIAGPLDLGNVVVRAALQVDPRTARVEAVSDPIPTILSGIPLNLRDIRVKVDRGKFTLNPSNCDATKVIGTIAGSAGTAATVSDRFQAGDCGKLGLRPKLSLSLKGATERGGNPRLRAVLRARKGDANLRRVSVALPHSEFLAQNHIGTICTRVQFAADECPAGSVYGYAKAYSPLLAKPLRGPVYLRSSDHPLPDLVAALRGQIDIDLAGRIDSVHGGIRDTFEGIPDAPITRFELTMKGGKKGLLENSRDLCRAGSGRATVQIGGQNGKTADQRPAIDTGCGKKK